MFMTEVEWRVSLFFHVLDMLISRHNASGPVAWLQLQSIEVPRGRFVFRASVTLRGRPDRRHGHRSESTLRTCDCGVGSLQGVQHGPLRAWLSALGRQSTPFLTYFLVSLFLAPSACSQNKSSYVVFASTKGLASSPRYVPVRDRRRLKPSGAATVGSNLFAFDAARC